MRLPNRTTVLFVALLAVLLSVPVIAGDGASLPVQASAAEGQAADCARVSPDLAVPLAPELAPVWSLGPELTPVEPIAQQGPPFRRGYCKCGCGLTCETDADCGAGGACVGFITCC